MGLHQACWFVVSPDNANYSIEMLNLSRYIHKMKLAQCIVFCALMAISAAAQRNAQPLLETAALPKYPPIARQVRIEGIVRISFSLGTDGTVSDAQVLSGHPMLKAAALENVRTWRFRLQGVGEPNQRFETEFIFRLSGKDVPDNPRLTVSLESFRHVEVTSDVVIIPDSPRMKGED